MVYASRAGEKLAHALKEFGIQPTGLTCADFGSSTGGFVDCLLQNSAAKVYAAETGYGVLDWKLRNDPRVVVMEKHNAMHVELPELMDIITIDTSWTKLEKIVPNALKNLKPEGIIIALLKSHYEADPRHIRKGKLEEEFVPQIVEDVTRKLVSLGVQVRGNTQSPILGEKKKNQEFLLYLTRA